MTARAKTKPAPQAHPSWCHLAAADNDRCTNHYSVSTPIPATAGDWEFGNGVAEFPVIEVDARVDADGNPGVNLTLTDPSPREGSIQNYLVSTLTPREAVRLAKVLLAAAELAVQP